MRHFPKFLLFGLCFTMPLISKAQAVEITDSTAKPTVYMVSNAHLDTQWNWDIQTTIGDHVWNTINRNLYLIDKYPDYIFNFEGGVKYSWMKEYYPQQFEKLKEHIASGRWHVSGASWDANDVNVPSIESGIRNILLGQDFYRKEFGVESTDIFLPDCFGFGWTLPTVASHCGLIGFSSQKLGWRTNPFYGDSKIPFTVGLWQGVDGSRVMMVHGHDYNTRFNDEDLTANTTIKDRVGESPLNIGYHYYGTGDIGGSPTLPSVVTVDRAARTNGPMNVISAASDQLYKDFLPYESHPELPVFDGELTMDVHGTGCYTSQAAMKLYNRQNELLGDAAERAAVAAELLGTAEYPSEALTSAWRRFIFHQFHDDLTGTSIPRAYEFSWNDELLSLKQFAGIVENSSAAVASKLDTRVKGTPVVLYNSLGHEATDVVEFSVPAVKRPAKVTVADANGHPLKSQITDFRDGRVYILTEATVPANGYTVIDVRTSGNGLERADAKIAHELENSLYKIKFDGNGDITSLVMKKDGTELVQPGKSIRLAMFEENESFPWPAWEILKTTLDKTPVSISDNTTMTLVEEGPLRTTLLVEKSYGDSKFQQYVRLYEGALADRIDFFNDIDWASTNALLKAEFPLAAGNPIATYDLGIGTIERGNNIPTAYEVYAQRWADLTAPDGSVGATVMSDSKYGWDKPDDNTLRHTLIHTPKTQNAFPYQDHQDFGHHTFTYSLVPHSGALDHTAASTKADVLNQRIKAFVTTKHPGQHGRSFSLAQCDNPDVAIKALKKAESSDAYVVRVYETSGKSDGKAGITFPFPIKSACRADGTEKRIDDASFSGNTLNAEVGGNGISTYLVSFDTPHPVTAATYANLPLDFDKRCFSGNAFEQDGDFSQGFSYAVELLPETLTASGVPFTIARGSLTNGKKCQGETVVFPEGDFNRLYILAASAIEDGVTKGTFRTGNTSHTLSVPSYTGFIGQWGHTGHTEGFLRDDEVAYIGTHRHSPDGDAPYEFTYMFKYAIDLPKGVKEVTLPQNPDMVVFAATLANDPSAAFRAAMPLYRTSIAGESLDSPKQEGMAEAMKSLVNSSNMIGWSGYVNEEEHPRFLHDGDISTKWCQVSQLPTYVDYDLGVPTKISGWSIVGAASENPSYITSTCLLQVRNDLSEEWKTVDALVANKRNYAKMALSNPVEARYVRLFVVQPEQSADGHGTRIYEFAVN